MGDSARPLFLPCSVLMNGTPSIPILQELHSCALLQGKTHFQSHGGIDYKKLPKTLSFKSNLSQLTEAALVPGKVQMDPDLKNSSFRTYVSVALNQIS